MFKSNKNESNKISKKETIRRVAILPSKELHRLSVDFSRARVEARRQSNYISEESTCQPRILHPAKISFSKECNLISCFLFGWKCLKGKSIVIKPKKLPHFKQMQQENSWPFMERWTFNIFLYIPFKNIIKSFLSLLIGYLFNWAMVIQRIGRPKGEAPLRCLFVLVTMLCPAWEVIYWLLRRSVIQDWTPMITIHFHSNNLEFYFNSLT